MKLGKEKEVDDYDLKAKENNSESCLAVVPWGTRGQSRWGPRRPKTEACNGHGKEYCHTQDDKLRFDAPRTEILVVRRAWQQPGQQQ